MPHTDRRVTWRLGASAAILVLFSLLWILVRAAFPAPVALPTECTEPVFLAHYSNDIEAVSLALRRGFCGVEVDVHWRDSVGLVVAHDALPETWTAATSLTLKGLLDSVPRLPRLIWLDFKNLSRGNAASSAAYVNKLIDQYNLRGRIIVEARRPVALWRFRFSAKTVIPAYWIPYRRSGIVYDAKLTVILGILGLPALSVPKKLLTPQFVRRFRRFDLFTWTCNTPDEIRTAILLGARVILTDRHAPPSVPEVSPGLREP